MADPRFFKRAGPFSLDDLAKLVNGKIEGVANGDLQLDDVAPLDGAGKGEISFLDNKKYIESFSNSAAAACIVHPDLASRAPDGMALLVTERPYQAYARIAQKFYPVGGTAESFPLDGNIDETASIGDGCHIDPRAIIGANAEIGPGCIIGPGAVIGPSVRLGEGCQIGANATVQFALIGHQCIIHPGASIGQDGFGFAPGGPPEGHIKVPQLGRVLIGDGVEIGANSTIDRGSGPDTKIGDGSKIDNLVQIAHNVELGMGCFLAAQVGISGSTKVGNFVMIGGQAGFAGHLNIGDGAQISAQCGVMRDVEPGARVAGSPAVPVKEFFRQMAALSKLAKTKLAKTKKGA